MNERPTLAIGLMSGTSLDGMDAALVRLTGPSHAELLNFVTRPYSAEERGALRHAIAGGDTTSLARLHVRLAEWAADAVETLLVQAQVPASEVALIAFHGQTIWHEPPIVTWQLGEPAVLAERFGIRVVSNFRSRDLAAGGQGAPLVPMADVLLFASPDGPRVLLNLGGMANLTFVPRRGQEDGVLAFDTGPGVAVIDGVAGRVDRRRSYDRDGLISAAGRPDEAVLAELLADPFFSEPPPKTTGRERFGDAYAAALHGRVPGPDGVATAVELTARSVASAVQRWTPGGWMWSRPAEDAIIQASWPRSSGTCAPAAIIGSCGSATCFFRATPRKPSRSRCSDISRFMGNRATSPPPRERAAHASSAW